MRSAIYEGTVTHRRHTPVAHAFKYRLALPLLDVDEIADVCRLHPLWSFERTGLVSYRRADYLGSGSRGLADTVRDLVQERTGRRPPGPVCVLAHLRTWGWLFNPIALYFCFDGAGGKVQALVAEVTNTPWHERHAYVVGPPGEHELQKALHVSPFFPMDQRYRLAYTAPTDRLTVNMTNVENEIRAFDATLHLRRSEISRRSMSRMIWANGPMTMKVSAAIYRQALTLWRAGAPFVAHPIRGREQIAPGEVSVPDSAGHGGSCPHLLMRSSTAATTDRASRPVHKSPPNDAAVLASGTAAPPTRRGTPDSLRTAAATRLTARSCSEPVTPTMTARG